MLKVLYGYTRKEFINDSCTSCMYASYEDVRGVSRFFGLQNLKNQRYLQRLVELEQDEVVVAVPPPRSRLDGEYACIHPCQ